jgi:hypothetical protein
MKSKINVASLLLLCLAIAVLAGSSSNAAKQLTEEEKAALKAADMWQCQNLMSLHAWYHSAYLENIEVEKIWVQKTPDPVWAQNTNYWKGMDVIKGYYGTVKPQEQRMGGFQWHTITSGVIQIADDRKTAKGVWYTPGILGKAAADGKLSLRHMWERYGVDFVNEDGNWKIWHLHVYTDFATPLGGGSEQGTGRGTQGRAERFGTETTSQAGAGAMRRTSSYTAKVGYKELGPDTPAALIPRPPEPYRTFGETFSYADPNEYEMFVDYKELKDVLKK